MAGGRYDSEWKEVQYINCHVVQIAYLTFVFKGLAVLAFTWSTVVLLGGFVSMIEKKDFWNLTMITLLQLIWIDDNFTQKLRSAYGTLRSSFKVVKNILTCNYDNAHVADGHLKLWVAAVVLSLVHNVLLCLCIVGATLFVAYGILITTWISIYRLKERDHYGDKDEDRKNMDPAHNLLYAMCVVQYVLYMYRFALSHVEILRVKQVMQAYGFGDDRVVRGYYHEIMTRCLKNPSSVRETNLITYAVELMESKSNLSYLSGTLILDRLLKRKGRDRIIVQQSRTIKRLVGSTSSTHILQKLLQTLDSKLSSDRKMREAAARIVEHVASRVHLDQLPRGIKGISSLINTFEEYHQLRPNNINLSESESDSDSGIDQPSSSMDLQGYQDLVLTGLRILWSLSGNKDNCAIISSTKHLVSKIMAPVSYDLVHRAGHSAWSTQVVDKSLGVMLRLIVTGKGDTRAALCQQISSDEGAITTMNKIVTCQESKAGELQVKAMQILKQLCLDSSADISNLIKVLVSIFVNGDSRNDSIRKTAGETLVTLFLGSKSVPTLLPKEEYIQFVCDLTKILLQVGDNDTYRINAAEILEYLCTQYSENGEYLSILKNAITGVMPEVRQIYNGSTGEDVKPEYARSDTDVESQSKTKREKKNKKNASFSRGENQQHKLNVALLSLCVTACDKLHLDLNVISLGQATDPGECVASSLARKMVQLNRDIITPDSLTAMKLTTRMVIAEMQKFRGHGAGVERANLESLMDSLSYVSETMLDLEGFMVFANVVTAKMPPTDDTLGSLVKQAQRLHIEIKGANSEIVPAAS